MSVEAHCGINIENLEHFLLDCIELSDERQKILELQQPYQENRNKIIENVLFNAEGIEKRKEKIYRMWIKREKKLKEVT